jgi:hypothetical protein
VKSKWIVQRTTVARLDSQRRWDYAYQFLVDWAMAQETGLRVNDLPKPEDQQNGSSPICSSFDQWSTTKSDD